MIDRISVAEATELLSVLSEDIKRRGRSIVENPEEARTSVIELPRFDKCVSAYKKIHTCLVEINEPISVSQDFSVDNICRLVDLSRGIIKRAESRREAYRNA